MMYRFLERTKVFSISFTSLLVNGAMNQSATLDVRFHKFSEIPSIYMIENIINLHQERKMLFMKRVKSRIYSTQELDKRKKAIFLTTRYRTDFRDSL